jgi:hypothetical protein
MLMKMNSCENYNDIKAQKRLAKLSTAFDSAHPLQSNQAVIDPGAAPLLIRRDTNWGACNTEIRNENVSALGSRADLSCTSSHFRNVPIPDTSRRSADSTRSR